ncbi:hypothetical protein PtA15_3A497 [Puccinia triticina]|uniref:Uncharacterized protein n=1 Tax=Puccinia triticina TaxID=208348 RepID=A0ABY7CED3_9BASI|nr:uncharacterized protein PtA15_3A497 [Puccinia triticina]WAQ83130.1 hypothetical protein PtA15_3A497 [Puccinia triticina]
MVEPRRRLPPDDSALLEFQPYNKINKRPDLIRFIRTLDPHVKLASKLKVDELRDIAQEFLSDLNARQAQSNSPGLSSSSLSDVPDQPSESARVIKSHTIPDTPSPPPAQAARSPARNTQSPARSPARRTARSPSRYAAPKTPTRSSKRAARRDLSQSPARSPSPARRTARSPAKDKVKTYQGASSRILQNLNSCSIPGKKFQGIGILQNLNSCSIPGKKFQAHSVEAFHLAVSKSSSAWKISSQIIEAQIIHPVYIPIPKSPIQKSGHPLSKAIKKITSSIADQPPAISEDSGEETLSEDLSEKNSTDSASSISDRESESDDAAPARGAKGKMKAPTTPRKKKNVRNRPRHRSARPLKSALAVKKGKKKMSKKERALEIISKVKECYSDGHRYHTRSGRVPPSASFDYSPPNHHRQPPDQIYYAEEGRYAEEGGEALYAEEGHVPPTRAYNQSNPCPKRRRYVQLQMGRETFAAPQPDQHRHNANSSEWRFTPAPVPFCSNPTETQSYSSHSAPTYNHQPCQPGPAHVAPSYGYEPPPFASTSQSKFPHQSSSTHFDYSPQAFNHAPQATSNPKTRAPSGPKPFDYSQYWNPSAQSYQFPSQGKTNAQLNTQSTQSFHFSCPSSTQGKSQPPTQSAQPPTSQFGQGPPPSTSAQPPTSQFGQGPPPATNSHSLFHQPAPPPTTGQFGQGPLSTNSLFGQSARPPPPSQFSQSALPPSTSALPLPTSQFSQSAPPPPPPARCGAQAAPPSNQSAPPPPPPSRFGGQAAPPPKQHSASLFSQPSSTSLFGQQSLTLFGQTSSTGMLGQLAPPFGQTSSTSMFGQLAPPQSNGLFGSSAPPPPPPSRFGHSATTIGQSNAEPTTNNPFMPSNNHILKSALKSNPPQHTDIRSQSKFAQRAQLKAYHFNVPSPPTSPTLVAPQDPKVNELCSGISRLDIWRPVVPIPRKRVHFTDAESCLNAAPQILADFLGNHNRVDQSFQPSPAETRTIVTSAPHPAIGLPPLRSSPPTTHSLAATNDFLPAQTAIEPPPLQSSTLPATSKPLASRIDPAPLTHTRQNFPPAQNPPPAHHFFKSTHTSAPKLLGTLQWIRIGYSKNRMLPLPDRPDRGRHHLSLGDAMPLASPTDCDEQQKGDPGTKSSLMLTGKQRFQLSTNCALKDRNLLVPEDPATQGGRSPAGLHRCSSSYVDHHAAQSPQSGKRGDAIVAVAPTLRAGATDPADYRQVETES